MAYNHMGWGDQREVYQKELKQVAIDTNIRVGKEIKH